MKFTLINIRTASSRNGFSMSATLVINDKSVCDFYDKGDGSMPRFDIINEDLYNTWCIGCFEIGEIYIDGLGDVEVDTTMFINLLHYAMESKTNFTLLENKF